MSWINDEYQRLDCSPRALRRFGFIIGIVLLSLGGLFLSRHRVAGWPLLSLATLLLVTAKLAPALLRFVYRPWMILGLLLGWLVTGILLTLVFVLVVTPVGFVQRLCGKRALEFGFRSDETSYWQTRTARPAPGDYEKQF